MPPSWLRWEEGRQRTGYRKMLLGLGRSWDAYILHYPAKVGIPMHVDRVRGKRHFRLNVVLAGDRKAFVCSSSDPRPLFNRWGVALFRPDLTRHCVLPGKGPRWVLSLGCALSP